MCLIFYTAQKSPTLRNVVRQIKTHFQLFETNKTAWKGVTSLFIWDFPADVVKYLSCKLVQTFFLACSHSITLFPPPLASLVSIPSSLVKLHLLIPSLPNELLYFAHLPVYALKFLLSQQFQSSMHRGTAFFIYFNTKCGLHRFHLWTENIAFKARHLGKLLLSNSLYLKFDRKNELSTTASFKPPRSSLDCDSWTILTPGFMFTNLLQTFLFSSSWQHISFISSTLPIRKIGTYFLSFKVIKTRTPDHGVLVFNHVISVHYKSRNASAVPRWRTNINTKSPAGNIGLARNEGSCFQAKT